MPTGYTADIKDGVSFEKFALNCARAFGACITIRDDPTDKPIPEKFEPNDYNLRKLEKTRSELNRIEEMTEVEAEVCAYQEYKNEIGRYRNYIEEGNKLESQYRSMLSKVNAWEPPTKDHIELKKFMVKQIISSIDFDCHNQYYFEELEKIKPLTGQEWLDKERKKLLKSLDYHSKEWTKEQERTNGRNSWVKALRKSLIT